MSKTIKTTLSIIQQRVKIVLLKNKIRKMESISYLDLSERMELRDASALLQSLEQQQLAMHNAPMFSLQ